jgi:D-glycero-D-manno-heptose 1,7-bisphosphate phosphatase
LVIVVSNQAGIARGYFDEDAVNRLHKHLQNELKSFGTAIDAFYFCPHHPELGLGAYKVVCECRKGAPGMLLQAAREHDIDLEQSFMVGDKLADIEAGRRAGCRSVLVLTGYGESVAQKQKMATVEKCQNLSVAVDLILKKYVVNRGVTD